MVKFTVSTDSTCDLYRQYVDENDVKFVSLTFTVEEKGTLTDGLDAFTSYQQYVDFYAKLRAGGFSKTSMLNLDSHYEHFLKLAKEGCRDVLHFTISSGLATTYTVAEKAFQMVKKDYPELNITVIDPLTATIGQGELVKAAVRLRDEGKSAKEAADYVNEMKHHIQHVIIANDLYYLKRGGRVSAAAAVAGTLLKVKPVLTFDREGKLSVVEKCKGMKKAFAYASDKMSAMPPVERDRMISIVHTDAEQDAEELKKMVEERYGYTPPVTIMGPVIGSHVGPGSVSVIWTSKELRNEK